MTGEHGPLVVHLDDETIERLARRVAELLDHPPPRRPAGPQRLLSAAQVSAWCGIDRSWIYEHADELGALRLGTGPKPRLRFDPNEVAKRLGAAEPATDGRRSQPMTDDSRNSTRLHRGPELSSSSKRNRPGGAPTPPATAPKKWPSAR